jgi:hypothetical protein
VSVLHRFVVNLVLNGQYLLLVLTLYDDLCATGRARQVAGPVITAIDFARPVRQNREVIRYDHLQIFVRNVFDVLNGLDDGLQKSASRVIAVSEGTIKY